MHNDINIKKKILLGLGFLLSPAFFGIPGAFTYFAAYKYLGVKMQLEPIWLVTIELLLASIAGISCIIMATKIIKLRKRQIILLAIPVFMYGWAKCISFQSEMVSFLGYSCCREEPASLISVLNMAFNPLAPFWEMIVH